jgi:hypothetical protein
MSAFVRNFTIVLAALSAVVGVFAEVLLPLFHVQISGATELRWTLVVGMPVLLFVSFAWLNQPPAKTALAALLQSVGQLALFLAPYWWVVRHAQ